MQRFNINLINKIGFIVLLLTSGAIPVSAHRIPVDCTGSGLAISLYANPTQAYVGDSISYSIDVFNGVGSGPIVCDATEIQASIATPDGQAHPISLSRTALMNGESDHYANVVTYVVRSQDVQGNGALIASANVTGNIHQNETDSQGGGFQGVTVNILSTPTSPSPTPVPVTGGGSQPAPTPPPTTVSGGGGGGSTPLPPAIVLVKKPSVLALPPGGGDVTYTYTVTIPGTVSLSNVSVTDNKCSPIFGRSGDLNSNNMLDILEKWVFLCQTRLTQTTTNIATAQGQANNATVFATSTAVVSVPTTLSFPNTGLAPEEKGDGFISWIIRAIKNRFSPQESVAPLATPSVTPMKPISTIGVPIHLKIPAIKVDSLITKVALKSTGEIDAPKVPADAGWFELGPRPGEKGIAIIDGHYGWKDNIPAVFDDLHTLKKGDLIYIEDEKGATTTFSVRELRIYGEKEDASKVFVSNDDEAHLVLITCGGVWDKSKKSYSERLVVFADKV